MQGPQLTPDLHHLLRVMFRMFALLHNQTKVITFMPLLACMGVAGDVD